MHCPAGETTAIGMCHCHEGLCLVHDNVRVGGVCQVSSRWKFPRIKSIVTTGTPFDRALISVQCKKVCLVVSIESDQTS